MRRVLASIAAIGMAAVSAAALAQNALGVGGSAPPVSINICEPIFAAPLPQPSPTPFSIVQLLSGSRSRGIHIQFTNESNKTADLVNFAVDSNGRQFVIRDVGQFSPGISIDHRYSNGAGQAYVLPDIIAPKISCSVSSVRFTDGTVWQPGAPAAPAAPATQAGAPTSAPRGVLTATPASVNVDAAAESTLLMVATSSHIAGFRETDDCSAVASVFVSTTSQSAAVYTIKPIAPGTCTAHVTDEAGRSVAIPIAVR